MPIYDFQCTACGYQQELMRKVSAPSVDACPKCAQQTFSKQVSAPNFQLTGSGWYATDFKNSQAKTSTQSTESAPAAEAAKCNPGCACH
ncbi:FmdB family zinc ribbon protein [Methylophilus sp. 5]|uniref:FmdB family zinc ribbon protein n=1 Tax=Methylophilus sp. 5 TaxID=1112274 RepID=UPI00048FB4F7|nr:zinc ribbon domain-containing protein [Methylophilus sp. 5]